MAGSGSAAHGVGSTRAEEDAVDSMPSVVEDLQSDRNDLVSMTSSRPIAVTTATVRQGEVDTVAGEEAALAVSRVRGRASTMPSLRISSSSRAVADPATSSSHMMRLRYSSEIAEASGSDEASMGNGEVSTGNGKASTSSRRVNAVASRAASLCGVVVGAAAVGLDVAGVVDCRDLATGNMIDTLKGT